MSKRGIFFLTLAFCGVAFGLPGSARAATIYANYTSGNDTTGSGTSGNPYKTFTKAYTSATSGDTLNLTGTFDWTNADETGDSGAAGFTIAKALTIVGQSASTTIIQAASSANTASGRVFSISTNIAVTLQNLTIRYGYITSGSGAGINNSGGGALTLSGVTITANNGPFSFVSGGVNSSGAITIDNSTFEGNVGGYFSALYVSAATTITNSTFYNNTGATYGGIYNTGGTMTVTNTLFASSSQIWFQNSPTVRVKNSIILGNPGAAVFYYYNFSGSVVDGGNNIVAGETGSGGSTGPYFTNGVNGTTKVSNATKVTDLNMTGTLADNGSLNGVQTLALQAGSSAIDAGSGGINGSVNVPSTDARGLYRDATPDIGPYEYNGSASPPSFSAPSTAATNTTVGSIAEASSTVSWTNGNGARRAVFMKADAASGTAAPADGTAYAANSVFGSGDQIGSSGWYTVYDGTGSSVTVSNLDNTRDYRVHVVEYNGPYSGTATYLTSAGSGNPANKSAYTGAVVYANYTSGNDSTGNGSSGSPYKTFTKAYAVALDGDTVDLTGTFNWANADEIGDASTSGYTIAKNNFTIRGQGAGTTTIQAASTPNSAGRRVFTMTSASTTIQNIMVRYGSTSNGGCIQINNSISLTMNGAAIDRCAASVHGGGIYVSSVSNVNITASNSSFTGNVAAFSGGGFYYASSGGTLQLTNTTLAGNVSNTSGSSNSTNGGSAINASSGTVRLTNATITGNSSPYGALKLGGATYALKNTILAGNSGANADSVNLYRSSGSLTSNGYNIFGIYNTSYFNATTTGDWDDRTGSGTYRLYGVGTTGTLSLAATTTAANGTQYAALSVGSVGIDHGSSAAHSSVSIPSTDQIGQSRSGATDIGAYEYRSADSTPPTVSLTLPDNGATIYGSAIGITASAEDDTAVAGVRFFVNNVAVGSEDTTAPYSIVWNSLVATSSGSKTIVAVARDSSNNYATSSARTVTLSNQPSPTSLTYTAATTSASVSWSTPVEGSTRMFFGFTSTLASSTPEQNTGTRVTSHSVDLTGLPRCSVFKYQTVSKNEIGETATSSQSTFKTAGCSGGASILANSEDDVTVGAGGTISQDVLSLTIPASFTSTSSQATFQAKKLDGAAFFSSVSGPTSKTRATTTVYNLSAYTDTSTTLSSFNQPLTVTFSYSDSDVSGLDEASLKIYRYDGSTWSALSSCTVDAAANSVSCTTTQFSDFGIFGDISSGGSSSTSSSGVGGVVSGFLNTPAGTPFINTPVVPGMNAVASTTPTTPTSNKNPYTFSRTLRAGSVGEDVRELQKFLNAQGFVLAVRGTGAKGNETTTFGPMTYNALVKFQEAYAKDILAPNGLSRGTGIFGPATRAFVNLLP